MADPKGGKKINGLQQVIDMLNVMDPATRERLLSGITQQDPTLAATIRKKLLGFADLLRMDTRDAQLLLRELPAGLLPLALRNAPGDVLNFVFANLSQAAGKRLREELTSQGPKRVSEIEAAQEKIIELARRLAAEGKIRLPA